MRPDAPRCAPMRPDAPRCAPPRCAPMRPEVYKLPSSTASSNTMDESIANVWYVYVCTGWFAFARFFGRDWTRTWVSPRFFAQGGSRTERS